MSMKIAIIGTRGIPNRYGGFEELAEQLSVGLTEKGHNITVYNSHNHPNQEKTFSGVQIIHCKDPEHKIGTAGQFVYDFNCVRDAAKRNFDVLLFLGYTSSSVWGRFYPKHTVIISNMDGLEWKRSKYPAGVRRFLHYAEKLAVKYSDHLIADSPAIQQYLLQQYKAKSEYIAYGAQIVQAADETILQRYSLQPYNYFMLMARMEPENNIAMILEGFHQSDTQKKLLVLGNTANRFGKKMISVYQSDKRIIFAGAVYDAQITHTLIHFSSLYFHGHSVGGTNPSLLQAMACAALIAAHDNEFNRAVLGDDGFYFKTSTDVQHFASHEDLLPGKAEKTAANLLKIKEQFNWPAIIEQYEQFIRACLSIKKT